MFERKSFQKELASVTKINFVWIAYNLVMLLGSMMVSYTTKTSIFIRVI